MTKKKRHLKWKTEVLILATQFYIIKNTPGQEPINPHCLVLVVIVSGL